MTALKIPDFAAMSPQSRVQYRKNAGRLLQTGTAPQKAAAQAALIELDRLERAEEQERRASIAGMRMPERVANAFTAIPPTETERNLLQVLLDNPDETSQELSSKLGWGAQSWHLHFGTMCQKREHLLWDAEPAVVRNSSFYSGILAIYSDGSHGFTMKHEVVEGLARIGIRPVGRYAR